MNLASRLQSSGKRVVILCGGSSTEREVSLVSGQAVADAFQEMGLDCERIALSENTLPDGLSRTSDLILPLIHGTYGEDGCLSGELESRGLAYGGCGLAASVLCFDKLACKAVAEHVGIPVAKDVLLSPVAPIEYEELAAHLGNSFILKPRRDGSSVGLHLIENPESYAAVKEDLLQCDYLAEEYVAGYDLTVGMLMGEPMGVVSVHPESGLYDYEHKYTSGMSRYEVPADIDLDMAGQLREWTRIIFDACGCRDLARVDFRLGTDGRLAFLEVNTIPGMTPTSLLPKSASCSGHSFDVLVLTWANAVLDRAKESIA